MGLLPVLRCCSALPLVRSPAMTTAAILVIFLHYRAFFWFQFWHTRTSPMLATSELVAAAVAAEEGPVSRKLRWLLTSPPPGQAHYWILMLYEG